MYERIIGTAARLGGQSLALCKTQLVRCRLLSTTSCDTVIACISHIAYRHTWALDVCYSI